jgi:sphingolipid delta-4 desaturase
MTKTDHQEFYWVDTPEPHLARRKEILKKHPEVKQLFGVNPKMRYYAVFLVLIQLTTAFFINQVFELGIGAWAWALFLGITYLIGATIAQAIFLAIHEITHNLAFHKETHNNILALFTNIPIVLPFAISFKIYHGMHHWEQGKDGIDMDIPARTEANFFKGFFGKMVWFVHQIVFYALRPVLVKPIKLDLQFDIPSNCYGNCHTVSWVAWRFIYATFTSDCRRIAPNFRALHFRTLCF